MSCPRHRAPRCHRSRHRARPRVLAWQVPGAVVPPPAASPRCRPAAARSRASHWPGRLRSRPRPGRPPRLSTDSRSRPRRSRSDAARSPDRARCPAGGIRWHRRAGRSEWRRSVHPRPRPGIRGSPARCPRAEPTARPGRPPGPRRRKCRRRCRPLGQARRCGRPSRPPPEAGRSPRRRSGSGWHRLRGRRASPPAPSPVPILRPRPPCRGAGPRWSADCRRRRVPRPSRHRTGCR